MSKEMQIEVVTYERERLDYFTELMQLARTRYSLLYHKFKDAPYMSEEHQMLSDIGREVQFFGDVVEMLENGYRKQSEGEWIAKHNMSRSSRGRYTSYNTYTCNVCGKANGRRKTPFCPKCGAKMKGV